MSWPHQIRWWSRVAVVALLWLIPLPAHAHLVQTGFGTFYDGMAHFALSAADVLVVVALALFIGSQDLLTARRALLALAGAWLLGGAVGMVWPTVAMPAWILAVCFGGVGGLVALRIPLPRSLVVAVIATIACLHGYRTGAGLREEGQDWLSFAGVLLLIAVVATLLSAVIVSATSEVSRIAVRVAGSWIAAIAILMLGWTLRGRVRHQAPEPLGVGVPTACATPIVQRPRD